MDARYLTQAHRDQLKRLICDRRDAVGKIIKRMEARQWYSDDALLQSLRAAYHALHAAVQALGATDGAEVKTFRKGPRYPL